MRVGTARLGAGRSTTRGWRTVWGGNGSARLAGRDPLHGGIHLERRVGSDVHVLGHGSEAVEMKRDRVTAGGHVQPFEYPIELVRVTAPRNRGWALTDATPTSINPTVIATTRCVALI